MYATARDIVEDILEDAHAHCPRELLSGITDKTVNLGDHHHIMIVGAAGTGKSYLLRRLYDELSQSYSVRKLAYTHTAADNIGGDTIHSAFIVDPKTNIPHGRCDEDIILIDECSMIHKQLLDNIWPNIKNKFVILFGDFRQLAPIDDFQGVITEDELKYMLVHWPASKLDMYPLEMFEYIHVFAQTRASILYANCIKEFVVMHLLNQHRMQNDLYELTNNISYGDLSGVTIERDYVITSEDTVLASRYAALDRLWKSYIDRNNIKCIESPSIIKRGESFYKILYIYPGLHVRIISSEYKNVEGVVCDANEDIVSIQPDNKQNIIKLHKQNIERHGYNFPIIPTQFMTIHRAQGLEYSRVVVCVDDLFEPGHLYTAVTRCKGTIKDMHFIRMKAVTTQQLSQPIKYLNKICSWIERLH